MASTVWLVVRSRKVASSRRISWTKSGGDMPRTATVVRCRVRSLTPIAAAARLICNGSATWSRTHRSNAVIVGSVAARWGGTGKMAWGGRSPTTRGRAIPDQQVPGDHIGQRGALLSDDRQRQVYVRERGAGGGDPPVACERLALVESHGGVAAAGGRGPPPAGWGPPARAH